MRKYLIYYVNVHDIALKHPELMRICDIAFSEVIPHDDTKEWLYVTTKAVMNRADDEIIIKIEKIS